MGDGVQRAQGELFRSEAIAKQYEFLGDPSGIKELSSWAVAVTFLSLLIAAVVFICTATYSRKVPAQGALIPSGGVLRVVADRNGVVADVQVVEGQTVTVGQPLMTITSGPILDARGSLGDQLAKAVEAQRSALEEDLLARREMQRQRTREIDAQILGLAAESEDLHSAIRLQQRRVEIAQSNHSSAVLLEAEKLVSKVELREVEDRTVAARQELSALRRQLSQAKHSSLQLSVRREALIAEGKLQDAEIRGQLAQVEEKGVNAASYKQIVLTSRVAGRLSSLRAKRGDAVTPGIALGTVIPNGAELLAEVWAPSSAIGFIRIGTPVKLMYDAYPYQKFGLVPATVVAVDSAPTDLSELPMQFRHEESLYRVLIRPNRQSIEAYGQSRALTPGMRLTADLVLEERSMLRWLFDPLLATQKRSMR